MEENKPKLISVKAICVKPEHFELDENGYIKNGVPTYEVDLNKDEEIPSFNVNLEFGLLHKDGSYELIAKQDFKCSRFSI